MSLQDDFNRLRRAHDLKEAKWSSNEIKKAIESEIFAILSRVSNGEWTIKVGEDQVILVFDRGKIRAHVLEFDGAFAKDNSSFQISIK